MSRRSVGQDRRPTELPYQLVLDDNLVRLMCRSHGKPQVAFLGATDPSTGRQGRNPPWSCLILTQPR